MDFLSLITPQAFAVFLEILAIDIVLAGDNAIVVGALAAGLPAEQRKKVILIGVAAALLLRIGFASGLAVGLLWPSAWCFLTSAGWRALALPFRAALWLPLVAGALTLILLSDLPIHASRRLVIRCLVRPRAHRHELAPVFKPLFFQVKRLPCCAAVMVSSSCFRTLQRALIGQISPSAIVHPQSSSDSSTSILLHVYVVFRHFRQCCFVRTSKSGSGSAAILAGHLGSNE